MTINEWRKDEKLCAWANALFNTPEWALLMKVMGGSHIRHGQLRQVGPSEVDCSRQLGKIEGWDLYQNTLDSACIKESPQNPLVESTFESPNVIELQTK